jgi:excisionase family DNA binding protein
MAHHHQDRMNQHEGKPRAVSEEQSRVIPVLMYRPEDAAEALQISRDRVYELLRSGQLRSVKLGKLRRIPVEALHEWVKQAMEAAA